MRRCENADKCTITECMHRVEHFWNYVDDDNNCAAQCDVLGGIEGSHCIKLPSTYKSPITGKLLIQEDTNEI